jgi:CDP-paratose 2-epimerase
MAPEIAARNEGMKILITGICGFVGSALALELKRHLEGLEILGLDNLSRAGSEKNRQTFKQYGIRFTHGDIRSPADLETLPAVDWVIDAAANPSVLAGTNQVTSRQLMEHNLLGTLNILEYCKRHKAGLMMLSTSRVYSLAKLCALPFKAKAEAFVPQFAEISEPGVSVQGINESFSTQPPVSLYGAAKLASELLTFEYSSAFDFPAQVNRCGVLAGAGQFGKPDQGIFSFWIHSYCRQRPVRYFGFGGSGYQVRDCLHPRDLAGLIARQLAAPRKATEPLNVSGGMTSAISLAQLSQWCAARFKPYPVSAEPGSRAYDVPWLVLDAARAEKEWNWRPTTPRDSIFEEIAAHAEQHPEWLDLSSDT